MRDRYASSMHENAVKHKSSGGTARSRCLSPLSAIAESRRVAYIGTAIPWSLIPRVLSFRCVHVRAYHAPFGAATSLVPSHVRLISLIAHQARLRYIFSPVSHPRSHSVVALWSSLKPPASAVIVVRRIRFLADCHRAWCDFECGRNWGSSEKRCWLIADRHGPRCNIGSG